MPKLDTFFLSDLDNHEEEEKTHRLVKLKSDAPKYGEKVGPVEGDEIMQGTEGLIYTAMLVSDDYDNPKHCTPEGGLKTRRPMPQVRARDFFSSLARTKQGKWVFNGILNGWPALTSLQLLKMEYVYSQRSLAFAKTYWTASEEKNDDPPYFPEAGTTFFLETPKSVRITLRKPEWSSIGYSEDSPGFFFWFSPFRAKGPRIAHGENSVKALEEDGRNSRAVRAHLVAHRYAKKRGESAKDKLTYHTAVLLEYV